MEKLVLVSVPEEKLEELIECAVQKAFDNLQGSKENDTRNLLTRKEASVYLNVSIATVDNWTRQGKLIKHYNGSAVRFKRSELDTSFESLIKYKRG